MDWLLMISIVVGLMFLGACFGQKKPERPEIEEPPVWVEPDSKELVEKAARDTYIVDIWDGRKELLSRGKVITEEEALTKYKEDFDREVKWYWKSYRPEAEKRLAEWEAEYGKKKNFFERLLF